VPLAAVERLRGVAAPAAAVEGCRALLAARTLQDQQACVSKLVPMMAGDRALAGSVTEAMFLWFTGAPPRCARPCRPTPFQCAHARCAGEPGACRPLWRSIGGLIGACKPSMEELRRLFL
jgi:hypothetical protein